ncbi:type II CAAX endopeptidase family protein [Roseateles sp.]|uniref:CPBP family intramembrane glutamic endopeptidase n=1 Tax=Roseateles sp. TaxID=1971397 RepID=UPI0031CFB044
MKTFRQRALELVRVFLALYLLGNITYPLSRWLWLEVFRLGPLHAELGASFFESALDILAVLLVFPRRLGFAGSRKHMLVGVAIAAGLTGAMVIGHLLGMVRWTPHQLRGQQWIYLIGFSVRAAVSEELVCRYLVLDRLGRVIGTPAAFLLQILLFVYLHMFGPPISKGTAVWLVIGAVLFGSLYLWRRSLLAVMALHFTYDLLVRLSFGSMMDGLIVYPLIVGDNFSKLYGDRAGELFMIVLSVWMLWRIRQRKRAAPETPC